MESSKNIHNSQRIRKYETAETMLDGLKKSLASRELFSEHQIDPKKQKRILNGIMPVKIKERQ